MKIMTLTVLAWVIMAWFAAGPWLSLAIGVTRGQALAGFLCGLIPLAGPFLALRIPAAGHRQ